MESEASELPKGLVLGRDGNIHIRLTGSIPLGDVGSYDCDSPSLLLYIYYPQNVKVENYP